MAPIKERVLTYLKNNNISKQKFCEKTGISYANMTGKSLQSELGGEQIATILMKFYNINPDWLLLGNGEMLRESEGKMCEKEEILLEKNKSLHEDIDFLRKTNTILTEHIELLKKELEQVRHELYEKTREARQLHSELEKKNTASSSVPTAST